MAESKHTPPSWVFQPEAGDLLIVAGAWPIGSLICEVNKAPREGSAEANAHLVAAAPDLLAVLKAVVAVADRKTDEFDAARAAIARAEGRAP